VAALIVRKYCQGYLLGKSPAENIHLNDKPAKAAGKEEKMVMPRSVMFACKKCKNIFPVFVGSDCRETTFSATINQMEDPPGPHECPRCKSTNTERLFPKSIH